MHVIVLASQKGGSSKSSLTAALSVAASKTGESLIVDTDPQQTLTAWWERREATSPALASINVAEIGPSIDAVRSRGQVSSIWIDTPPTITESLARVIAVADLVLIPVRPSPADLWAVGETVALCKRHGREFLFVLTQATRGASLTAQAVAALSEHGSVSTAIQHHRVAVAAALASGRTPQEIEPRGLAASEISALLESVLARVSPSKIFRKTSKRAA